MVGDVHPLWPAGRREIGSAVSAYLATLAGVEQAGIREVYGSTLRALPDARMGSWLRTSRTSRNSSTTRTH
ncbi:MAG: hypothetical protein JWN00_4720 [Actinomycetia bacterium]|nr:hypothetical protein [Actinomycetes bacterium]